MISMQDSPDLTGSVPDTICWLVSSPRVLALARNGLEGALPACLGRDLSNLAVLDLSGNRLTGPISLLGAIAPMENLKVLRLHGNLLRGPLFPAATNTPALRQLLAHDNYLTGPVPPLPPNLEELSLHGNLLAGPLPALPKRQQGSG